MHRASNIRQRHSFAKVPQIMDPSNFLDIQLKSFKYFEEHGIREVFDEVNPVTDYTEKYELYFRDYYLEEPKLTPKECKEKDLTYSRKLYVNLELLNKETGEIREEKNVFLANIPWMTPKGTFIVNGTERVVVSQIIRSPGVYFPDPSTEKNPNQITCAFIPARGSWVEIVYDTVDLKVYVRLNKKGQIPIVDFLYAIGLYGNGRVPTTNPEDKDRIARLRREALEIAANFEILDAKFLLGEVSVEAHEKRYEESLKRIYKVLKPGEVFRPEDAIEMLFSNFFNPNRFNLERVGRYKINSKLGLDIPEDVYSLTPEDILAGLQYLIRLAEGDESLQFDDIDSLENKRVRPSGELVKNQFRAGLVKMVKQTHDKKLIDAEISSLSSLLNTKIISSSLREFFSTSQLFQLMEQTNTLSALTHRRRLSAFGPGGLSRDNVSLEVRDVHLSHYGKICPIETPEGQNAGLITSLTTYARVNEYGFIETPYRVVENGRVTDKVVFLTAEEEKKVVIANGNAKFDPVTGEFLEEEVVCRKYGEIELVSPDKIDYIDLIPAQITSVSASLIPFLEHDDANRALMGANMQRQAVPLIRPEAPLVGTGFEHKAVVDAKDVIIYDGEVEGEVTYVSSEEIRVRPITGGKEKVYRLEKFERTNQGTCYNQRPYVKVGDKVKPGDLLADGYVSESGELALGRNLLVAFMPWEGYNYEDAIVISERLVKEDLLSSIHIEEYEVEVRDTKLGNEEITREIPGVSEEALKHLDENGIVRIGAVVGPNDILVGKVTPKGESESEPEDKLLKALFSEKVKERRDTSLRVPHGEGGKVIDVKIFEKDKGDDLNAGVLKLVRVYVAQWRKISVGDKLAGRHGNKGVISIIVPEEDMPFLEDGTPVDVILNPLGVPSRMNVGQILETHLGWAAANGFANGGKEKVFVETPVFTGATEEDIKNALKQADLPISGKTILYDGRTGEPFENPITVGHMYIMKLIHMVDDKIHARSVGPYSLVTRQPLGGRAQFGGQRFGEMEVWALEGYGAAHTLQEMLTIKSDDTRGRIEAYEAITKGENIPEPAVPEAFKVLVKELQSLAINVLIYDEHGRRVSIDEEESRRTRPDILVEYRDESAARDLEAAGFTITSGFEEESF
ncbi:MAG: DNA-directed RNA polymerase subunit beta [Actinobacteria bacterium]|nr:DNA-directed RNA polymerase subunit beta [Actinomycetota bacterium]